MAITRFLCPVAVGVGVSLVIDLAVAYMFLTCGLPEDWL